MTRNTIIQKIRALREKTTANGCTEAEAMAAAGKVARLMREHCLSERDLVIVERASKSREKGRSAKAKLWPVIAWCTNTRGIVVVEDNGQTVVFVGHDPWPEVACYLRDICDHAIEREVKTFKQQRYYRARRTLATKRKAVRDFTQGMVQRLALKLAELFQESQSDAASEDAARALAERYQGSTNIRRKREKISYSEAAACGWAAGAGVNLGHGVTGSAGPQLALEGWEG